MAGQSARATDGNLIVPEMSQIAAGWFWQGSDDLEREYAYRLDEQIYGRDVTRRHRWYDVEMPKWRIYLPEFDISTTPITNDQYAAFVRDTGHPAPMVEKELWDSFGLVQGYEATRPFIWQNGAPPPGRGDHPVVLVSWQDARAYVDWLSRKTGEVWRLPTEAEWEKAVRGPDGIFYPWGNIFDPKRLNSADAGPFDTRPVKQYEAGPYGLYDGAGQVFEWTMAAAQAGYRYVKGGSWDDRGCGVCRPAARHSRAEHLRHILIGFRVVHGTTIAP
ncbi:SUMF1/EgtB/PvdO family nonheme iron enzyme [Thalassospira sp.]|uniref:formylglycine-generating enzyme family protein n=1 Tax=Thalassospira sp. TaxID=1912094 RepID=UPI0027342B2F|nr:SUMF1/EgtB/PvdO family nonheme iron enzyme [Thalassospira sp.]MDP2696746.1 SUMF1/EgtB/PvdO family nonheme iron enzyme [Thalassospira sp.]